MNKQTKTLLMVGGGAVVAYLIYKAMTKPTTSTTETTNGTTAPFVNAMGRGSMSRGMIRPTAPCKRSPEVGDDSILADGTKIYECCGSSEIDGTGTKIYGTAKGITPCKKKGKKEDIFVTNKSVRIFK